MQFSLDLQIEDRMRPPTALCQGFQILKKKVRIRDLREYVPVREIQNNRDTRALTFFFRGLLFALETKIGPF